ncbi:hypothetical protein COU95_02725 [Candidatus Shapirobacteria bacterium CG10_big_fil_rev_8_21_14_0_10_40_9]|uniref:Uncharacterized protein n=1 Tax=Candidatus Shapirobacteria bacterium CG10_big_fil_rev_8_21_14_0_10_40_9 TaxID=1974888 RepID=A0A2M8L3C9_9BACT|nr:MAG: hypothetical protein COU95_02725 [Candidatus Shapirobacteria bacterium CG10_big_fil_rev_8_21_14_0_10_40_9]
MLESNKSIKVPGPILWARYSFSPNRLKYCGPDANLDLFERAAYKVNDKKIREILADFEAAFPYIQFIAKENKIRDPFDWRVVEAYWLGNDLLEKISVSEFYRHIKDHFGKRAKSDVLRSIGRKIPQGAEPHHSFHVLEVFPQIGALRGINLGPVLKTINNCLITWGKVVDITNDKLEVEFSPLIYEKSMTFGDLQTKKIDYKFNDKTLLDNLQIGDWVSIHWNWACDILTDRQLKNLQKWTLWHLNLANQTF